MASPIAATARLKFSEMLEVFGETCTVALRSAISSATFDSNRRLIGTSTDYGSATEYTACVQVNSFDPRIVAHFEGMGLKGREVCQVFWRYDVAVEEGDKVTTSSGLVYVVRWAPESEDSYRATLCARVEGMQGVD